MSEDVSSSTGSVSVSGGGELHSVSDIVSALKETAPEVKDFEGSSPEVGDEGEAPDNGRDVQTEPNTEGELDYPLPDGWDASMWGGMTAEVRGKVNEAMRSHADALSAKERAMQEMQTKHASQLELANANAQNVMNFVSLLNEGEFQNVDWETLRKDPALFLEVSEKYQARKQAIADIQAKIREEAQAIAAHKQMQAAQAMKAEAEAVLPTLKALFGSEYNGKRFQSELGEYLTQNGVPKDAVGSITRGYELVMASKAMLYDKMMARRAEAQKKVAEAPKVQTPHGSAKADGEDVRGQRLRALEKNPRDNAAIAALLKVW